MTNMTEIQNMLDEGVGTEHISRCFEFSFLCGYNCTLFSYNDLLR